MESNNSYSSPKSNLSEQEGIFKQSTFLKKFLYGFFFTLIIFIMIIIFTLPKQEWGLGWLGGAVFGVFSGVISAIFPSQKKWFIYQ